jgi:hypothetical protein
MSCTYSGCSVQPSPGKPGYYNVCIGTRGRSSSTKTATISTGEFSDTVTWTGDESGEVDVYLGPGKPSWSVKIPGVSGVPPGARDLTPN